MNAFCRKIIVLKIVFLYCIVFISYGFLKAQTNSISDSIYKNEVVQFIRTIRNQNKWNGKIVLVNEPERIILSNWQRRKMVDDSFFTKEDKEVIQLQFDKSKKYKWQYVYAGNSIIIDSSTLLSIFTDSTKKWLYFQNTYKVDFYFIFSAPIFFRNYNYCLFVYCISCPGLCGMMRFYVYKKENGRWKVFEKLDDADA